jgi:L-threonylcarbamoyladenylate synthase
MKSQARILSYNQASQVLINGGVGIIPTDTLYGIVACAANKKAVERMYSLKQRDHKPGTIIAANAKQLIDLGVDKNHLNKAKQWWPGSLSVETPLGDSLSYLHQNTGRQGIRIVADETVRQLLEQTGPLVTSSANRPGEAPANTVEEAYQYFGDSVDFYVDGGNRFGCQPSTIVRIANDGLEMIRQGVVIIPEENLIKR